MDTEQSIKTLGQFISTQGLSTLLIIAITVAMFMYLPEFMEDHRRIADSSVKQVDIGRQVVNEIDEVKDGLVKVESKVENLTQEVKELKENSVR